ncbi:hypothetical protein BDV59DRAFT_184867 [Aspergillus ambiguus]|uniref:uncharacterized protein n=1 Tax=Aspergillus ambiguus TaxID=176160 RepID=UPI003CCD1B11
MIEYLPSFLGRGREISLPWARVRFAWSPGTIHSTFVSLFSILRIYGGQYRPRSPAVIYNCQHLGSLAYS